MPLSILLTQHIIKTKENLVKVMLRKTTAEEKAEIFARSNNEDISKQKRSTSPSLSYDTASNSSKSSHKAVRFSFYRPLYDYAVQLLSKQDRVIFEILLLRLTSSCGWTLSWVNNPEAKELFQFLNSQIKLPDHRILLMMNELEDIEIKVSAVVTDSAAPYAAASARRNLMEQLLFSSDQSFMNSTGIEDSCNKPPTTTSPKSATNRRKPNYKSRYFEIIETSSFWTNLMTIADILYSYCKTLNILQRDNSFKALDISKLRAEITWNHHNELCEIELESGNKSRIETESEELEEPEEHEEPEESEKSQKNLRMQVTILILLKNLMDTEDEDKKILSVYDVVHPAVNSNAEWDLIILFNEIELP
ncbi:hypothetical protein C2G38_2253823 [Gigaspora rosea]|uniref:Uncharacterized protein n=1 Tax=Gigaspora rosea TaxID=44941 RepID=A0A397U8M7_9GLOM|nr:hypothetical protein C2G38_2253823 [Gigaspora rosea]